MRITENRRKDTKMKNRIEIKTALHEGIYKSDGGGQTRVHYSWAVGPRNLMRALEALPEHSESMTTSYGNHGHSGSWIEIAGVRIGHDGFTDYEFDTDPSNFYDSSHTNAISKTVWCKRFIVSVLDGSLVLQRRDFQKYQEADQTAYYAGLSAGRRGEALPTSLSGHEYELKRGFHNGQLDRAELMNNNSEITP